MDFNPRSYMRSDEYTDTIDAPQWEISIHAPT